MAQNTTITLTPSVWTQLTNADVNTITFQNVSDYYVFVKGTADATAPTDASGSIRVRPNYGEANVLMTDLFPGLTAKRLWAFSNEAAEVMVSHA